MKRSLVQKGIKEKDELVELLTAVNSLYKQHFMSGDETVARLLLLEYFVGIVPVNIHRDIEISSGHSCPL